MKKYDLDKILDAHRNWLKDETDGLRADLSYADLSGADLSGANLSDANLRGADLRDANLRGADLRGANLRYANLRYANLHGANLDGADLDGADLVGADLHGANLVGADLDDHIICLDRIGSAKRKTTYNATKDIVWCGWFTGTFAQWCYKIKNEYPKDNVYRKEYEAAIAYFKTIVAANKKDSTDERKSNLC